MIEVPDFLKPGQLVEVDRHWPGIIQDVAVSAHTNRIMVQINSLKAIWRNHHPEWLEYQVGRIVPVSYEDVEAKAETYVERIERMLETAQDMQRQWAERELEHSS